MFKLRQLEAEFSFETLWSRDELRKAPSSISEKQRTRLNKEKKLAYQKELQHRNDMNHQAEWKEEKITPGTRLSKGSTPFPMPRNSIIASNEERKHERKRKKKWNHEPYIYKGTLISSRICSCKPCTVQNVPRQDVGSPRRNFSSNKEQ